MKNKFILPLVLALAVPLGVFGTTGVGSSAAEAASAKEWVQLSPRATYYGEVSKGKPNGRGTIKWGNNKQYSGTFVNGKRSGKGKYVNTYLNDKTGLLHKVVYNGRWSGDMMNGNGTRTEKVVALDGTVVSNGIQTGTFKANVLSRGYDVVHALADPDYSFSYRAPNYRLNILGSNISLLEDWKTGTLFEVEYRKGSISKNYSIFQGRTAEEEKKRLASLRYLRSVTSEITPILWQFRAISKQLDLK
ncbi:hypothetical protein [Saccharibacillus kuerlensis]|uniref:MORN repeat-containing protein n=1 Tax=Saccharibacillus kuerlensis TaxID=459527 RepID=A0ABQ2LBL8_9BACL|nr:hypothetical protein [Saccharibacillus kuerlensis]GGO09514.1 hypothetical protein GCM10010969_40030 [Saccharibacillus kuerlensis]